MKPILSRALATLALALVCSSASAGDTTGQIRQVFTFEYPGVPPLFFVLIGSGAGPASCGPTTAAQNRWVTRMDTPAGKAHMATVLMAKAMGRSVSISGKGNPGSGWPNGCDTWGDTESIHAVFLTD